MPTEIDSLQIRIESQSSGAAQNIDELAASLNNLKSASGVTKIRNGLNSLSAALSTFQASSTGMQRFRELTSALTALSNVGNLRGLSSSLNTLRRIPEITNSLDAATLDAFANACNRVSIALSPLSARIQTIGNGFANMPTRIRSTAVALNTYSQTVSTAAPATERLAAALTSTKAKFSVFAIVSKKAYSAISGWVTETNSYVENVNLFTVSMGKYADEAMRYAESVNETLGVDISEFIRNQGIFMSMATGFGLAADQAYKMSRGLTELSYDLASFFNISLDAVGDGAFAKVQSGIAGELEPLRRLGFALSEASLQQVAYNHGIDLSVREMTEAQKATLRYTAMVEQAADMGAIGDMARTVTSSANAMRILQQQLKELRRELGSLFIPILMKVLPYLQAFVRVLTDAAHKVAAIIGFTLPTMDYSDIGLREVENAAESATESLESTAASVKELKSQMTGIDELNVISQDAGIGGSGSDAAGDSTGNGYASDLGLDIESIWDDTILKNIENQVDELIPKMESLAMVIGAVATVWGAIKVGSWITTIAKVIGGTSLITNFKAFIDLLREGCGFLPTFSAAFPTLAGILTTLGGGSLGAGLAVAAGIIVLIGSAIYYVVENVELVKNVIKEFFEQQIAPKLENIKESFQHIGDVLQPIADFFKPVIDAVGKFITETLGIKSLGDVFEAIGAVVFHVVASVIGGAFNAVISIIQGFVSAIEGVVDIVAGVIGVIVNLFTGDLNAAWESVVQIGDGIADVFKGLWDITVGAIIEFVDGVCGWFKALWDELVGHSIVPDTINAIIEWFASLPGEILSGLKQFCDDVAQKFKDMWESITSWFAKNVSPKFTKEYWVEKLDGLKSGAASILESVCKTFKDKWNEIKGWWTSSIAPKFTKEYWIEKLNGLKEGAASMLDSVKKTLSDKWDGIKSWWSESIAPKFTKEYWTDAFVGIKDGFVQSIKDALNIAIEKLNGFIGWINDKLSFTIPGFTVFEGGAWETPFGDVELPSIGWSSKDVTLLSLPQITQRFAEGGFIEDGLFTMNQGEIAGRFNNGKSVVANNEQIIAGISEGVYSAVVAAMGNGGGRESQNVNVYLDGKQIYSSVKKTESERGKQIFGNQLGYGY